MEAPLRTVRQARHIIPGDIFSIDGLVVRAVNRARTLPPGNMVQLEGTTYNIGSEVNARYSVNADRLFVLHNR